MIQIATLLPLNLGQQIILALIAAGLLLCGLASAAGWIRSRIWPEKYPLLPSIYAPHTFPTRWDAIFTGVFITYYLYNCAISLLYTTAPQEQSTPALHLILALILTGITYLPMVIRLSLVPGAVSALPPGARLLRELKFAFLIALATILIASIYHVSGIMHYIAEQTDSKQYQDVVLNFMSGGTAERISIFLGATIIAPIGEEFCFRGFLYGTLRKYSGPLCAAICSSFIFALVHTSLPALLPLMVFALLQCWAYEKTKSLRVPILAHILFNAIEIGCLFLPME